MSIWIIMGIWVVGLTLYSLINFLIICWLWTKGYEVNEDGDSLMAKLVFTGELGKYTGQQKSYPLRRIALFGAIPFIGTILVIIYWFLALSEEDIELPNPIQWIAKLMFRSKYLLDRVAKEI